MVVLVTGASTGIGKACAEYLGAKGFRVYGTSRNAPADPTRSGSYRMLRMDVTDSGSIRAAIERILLETGRIGAVFNNAGVHSVGPLEDIPVEEIEKSYQTNCLGPMRVCKVLVPVFRAQGGGRIINMSSLAGTLAVPFQSAYSGSKFALEGMTGALRAEVRGFGIAVSLINPGDIRHQDCHGMTAASQAYEPCFSNAMKVAWDDEEKGYPPERIGPLVERILTCRKPRLRYYFGQAGQSSMMLLKRILPERVSELFIASYYNC
jgi:NAD(P)-dependent dehydrogenase (short-subunit alcohol dehydrogenase family)